MSETAEIAKDRRLYSPTEFGLSPQTVFGYITQATQSDGDELAVHMIGFFQNNGFPESLLDRALNEEKRARRAGEEALKALQAEYDNDQKVSPDVLVHLAQQRGANENQVSDMNDRIQSARPKPLDLSPEGLERTEIEAQIEAHCDVFRRQVRAAVKRAETKEDLMKIQTGILDARTQFGLRVKS